MSATVGERVYAVRLALGDGTRTPLPMRAFADLLNERQTVRKYDGSVLSNIETGKRAVGLDEVAWIAALDPLKRGRGWLAWGDVPASASAPRRAAESPAVEYGQMAPEPEPGADLVARVKRERAAAKSPKRRA